MAEMTDYKKASSEAHKIANALAGAPGCQDGLREAIAALALRWKAAGLRKAAHVIENQPYFDDSDYRTVQNVVIHLHKRASELERQAEEQ